MARHWKTSSLLILRFGELLLFWICVTIPRGSYDGSELEILIAVSVLLFLKYFNFTLFILLEVLSTDFFFLKEISPE